MFLGKVHLQSTSGLAVVLGFCIVLAVSAGVAAASKSRMSAFILAAALIPSSYASLVSCQVSFGSAATTWSQELIEWAFSGFLILICQFVPLVVVSLMAPDQYWIIVILDAGLSMIIFCSGGRHGATASLAVVYLVISLGSLASKEGLLSSALGFGMLSAMCCVAL